MSGAAAARAAPGLTGRIASLDQFRGWGHAAFFFLRLLRAIPASLRRFGLVVDQIYAIGNRSLIIIAASGLAVGFVLALQMYYALVPFGAVAGKLCPTAIRIAPPDGDGRTPNVEAEAAHGLGWFEVQDEGSQIAAAMTGARPGDIVLDLCAGVTPETTQAATAAMGAAGITLVPSNQR